MNPVNVKRTRSCLSVSSVAHTLPQVLAKLTKTLLNCYVGCCVAAVRERLARSRKGRRGRAVRSLADYRIWLGAEVLVAREADAQRAGAHDVIRRRLTGAGSGSAHEVVEPALGAGAVSIG